jgi:type IV secretory pathway VirB10-like protein
MQMIWLEPALSQKVETPSQTKIKLELTQKLTTKEEITSKKVELPSGTKIKLELADEVSSKTAEEGDEVVYFVKEDVLSSNKEVLIKKGSRAIGKVTAAKRARSFGRKGKLEFTVEEVEAVDGTLVPLRSSVNKDGKGRVGTMVAVTALVSVFGVFIKGKNVTVKQGTIVDAYVDDNLMIEVLSLSAQK